MNLQKIFIMTICSTFLLSVLYAAEPMVITLDDATLLALENSLEIQSLNYEIAIAKNSEMRAKSVFDIFINGAVNYSRNKKMLIPQDSGSFSKINTYNFELSKKFASGTDVSILASQSKVDDYLYGVRDNADFSLSINQSLGRNFFGLQDRGLVNIAKIGGTLSELISLDGIEQQIATVQKAYWFLSLQDSFVDINKKMYNQALDLYKIYEEKKQQGAAEEADFLAIKANLLNREKSVLLSILNRDKAKNNLLVLLNHDDMTLNLSTSVLPNDIAHSYDLIQSMNKAMVNRRDHIRNTLLSKQNNINIKLKKAALWPQIDLLASYSANGIDRSTTEAWDNISNNADDLFFVGVSISLSLNNRAQKVDNQNARLKAKQIIAKTRSTELLIVRQITNSINTLNTLVTELNLSYNIMKIQKNKLIEEEKRVEFGRSNVDVLVRYQDDARLAEMKYQETLYKFLTTRIDHMIFENTLLEKYV